MNANIHDRRPRRSLYMAPALIMAFVLLVAVLGNRFVDGWSWGIGDFVVVGACVFGATFAYQLITRNVEALAYRSAVGIALVAALLLVWINAVQASDGYPAARMYFGVPIVGIAGAVVAHSRPNGMPGAMFATALAQAIVLVAIFILRSSEGAPWATDVWRGFGLNAFFLVLFVISGLLFRKAAPGR